MYPDRRFFISYCTREIDQLQLGSIRSLRSSSMLLTFDAKIENFLESENGMNRVTGFAIIREKQWKRLVNNVSFLTSYFVK